jgi:hypothetical protein
MAFSFRDRPWSEVARVVSAGKHCVKRRSWFTVKFFRQRLITAAPAQSSKLLLVLANTVFLGFGHVATHDHFFLSFSHFLYGFLKWGLRFDGRRGLDYYWSLPLYLEMTAAVTQSPDHSHSLTQDAFHGPLLLLSSAHTCNCLFR